MEASKKTANIPSANQNNKLGSLTINLGIADNFCQVIFDGESTS
jgi:hypothetical protein